MRKLPLCSSYSPLIHYLLLDSLPILIELVTFMPLFTSFAPKNQIRYGYLMPFIYHIPFLNKNFIVPLRTMHLLPIRSREKHFSPALPPPWMRKLPQRHERAQSTKSHPWTCRQWHPDSRHEGAKEERSWYNGHWKWVSRRIDWIAVVSHPQTSSRKGFPNVRAVEPYHQCGPGHLGRA